MVNGMVNVDLYSANITKVSNALDTLVSGEKPGFQTLSEGLVVLLCKRLRYWNPHANLVGPESAASCVQRVRNILLLVAAAQACPTIT